MSNYAVCEKCGLKFELKDNKPTPSRPTRGRFCSIKCFYSYNTGKNCTSWKEKVTYQELHKWVAKEKGNTDKCEKCGTTEPNKNYQWSNIDHKYRRNLDDYIRLCAKCHVTYDVEHFKKESICIVCGTKTLAVKKSKMYCSVKCKYISYEKRGIKYKKINN